MDGEILKGNNRFEGYSMDLMMEVSEMLGIKFEIDIIEGSLKFKTIKLEYLNNNKYRRRCLRNFRQIHRKMEWSYRSNSRTCKTLNIVRI